MEKAEKYRLLERQVAALLEGETDVIAKMANVAAVLHETFGFWWTGFYRVAGEDAELVEGTTGPTGSVGEPVEPPSPGELVLGPFQGPVACMHIPYGKGVCGTAWKRNETVVVPDVEEFPGHIACSSASRSEIVVPMKKDGRVVAVLDIDSRELSTFDEVDARCLEQLVALMTGSR
jgi:GAF domain-containing protein